MFIFSIFLISYKKTWFSTDLQNNFTKGATKNIHSKFRSSTQVLRDEAERVLKNQKNMIQGDTDNTLPEDELESAKKLKLNNLAFKEDKEEKAAEIQPKSHEKTPQNVVQEPDFNPTFKKKDHKTKFLTTINPGVNSDAETKNLEQKQEKVKAINNHPYRHLIFTPVVTESTLKKHLSITYRGLVYSVKCLKGPTDKFIKTKQVSLIEPKSWFLRGLLDLFILFCLF